MTRQGSDVKSLDLRWHPRFEMAALAGITLAGLVLRLALWSTQALVSVDGTTYIRMARELIGGPGLETVHPWGYPVLILLAHLVAPDWVLAARLVALVSGLALIPLTWLVAREVIRNRGLRLLPPAAVALLPLPVRYSLTTMSEAPYLAVLALMFLLAARKRLLAAGVMGGLAYAIRPEALTAVVVLAVISLRVPRRALGLAAGAALVVLPYVVVQGATTGHWTLTQKVSNLAAADWRENEPHAAAGEAAPAALVDRVKRYGGDTALAYPGRLAVLTGRLLHHGGWIVVPLALAGLAGPAGFLGAGLVQVLVTPIFALGGHDRFVLPMLPWIWILAMAGLERIPRPGWRWALAALCVAGLGFSAIRERAAYRLPEDGTFPELVEAGGWLRPFVGPETVVYDRKPYTAFFAGATYREIPTGSYDEILDAIVAGGGDYLVVDQAVVDYFRPELLPLAVDKAAVWWETRTRPIYLNTRYQNRSTVIYRVVRPGGPPPFDSEATMKKQLGDHLKHPKNHFFHGILAMRGEHWLTAAGEFNRAIIADSTNAVAFNNRAWCLMKDNKARRSAQDNAHMAVRLEPDNLDFLDTLVHVLLWAGKPDEAAFYRARLDSMKAARAEPSP